MKQLLPSFDSLLNLPSLKKLSDLKLILWSVVLGILLNIIVGAISHIVGLSPPELETESPSVLLVLGMLVLAPVLETLIFQGVIIFLIKQFTENLWVVIIVAALIFGSAHYPNNNSLYEVIAISTSGGIIYNFMYLLAGHRKRMNPLLMVMIIHFGHNAIALSVRLLAIMIPE